MTVVMQLNTIRDNAKARSSRKRVGRGVGSGLGKTCGAGQKGQKARTGVAVRAFEGGQMPLHRRLPKRGFKHFKAFKTAVVNLDQIQMFTEIGLLEANQTLTMEKLSDLGLVSKGADRIKLLAIGDLETVFTFEVHAASEQAIAKVKAAGGTVTILGK